MKKQNLAIPLRRYIQLVVGPQNAHGLPIMRSAVAAYAFGELFVHPVHSVHPVHQHTVDRVDTVDLID